MSDALLKFVKNEKPIQGMNAEAYAWLRLRAASALANLGSLGEKNEVHDALIQLIATSKSIDNRCEAAALLGSLKYEKAKIDGPNTTKALFQLTSDLSKAELKRAQEIEKQGDSGFSPSAEFGSGDADSKDDGYPRRHVVARLVNVAAGLRAVKSALPEESQKQVDAILAAFKPVVTAATDDKTGRFGVADAVRTLDQSITVVVGDLGGTEEDEEEGFTVGGEAGAPGAAGAGPAATTPGDSAPAAAPAAAAPATPPATAPGGAAAPPAATPAEGAKN
jgi:hypothetical protein